MFSPYPHQIEYVDRAWASLEAGKKPLIVLGTGGGKTAIAGMLASQCDGRVIVVCCLVSLIQQFYEDMVMAGVPDAEIGILQGNNSDSLEHLSRCRVVIAMAQTLGESRGLNFLKSNKFDMSIGDEKHLRHIDAGQALVSATLEIGMTATPIRGDGDESLLRYDWIQVITMRELIEQGKLVDFKHYFYPEDLEEDDALDPSYVFDEWRAKLLGRPTLGFCKSIAEAEYYSAYFGQRGCPCAVACDETPEEDFARSRALLRAGEIHIIWSVRKIATGFNEPCAEGILLCKKLSAIAEWVQIIGRILRKYHKKNQPGVLLDFYNNGCRLENPLPDPRDIVDWMEVPSPSGKTCDRCGLKNGKSAIACSDCGNLMLDPEEKRKLVKAVREPVDLIAYRRTRPMEPVDRSGEILDQLGTAKAAREAAFWEHGVDPRFAIDRQKELYPGVTPIVHSSKLGGAIFGRKPTPKDLAAYLAYLRPYAGKRSDPDAWVKSEIRSEMGEVGIQMLAVACNG